MYQFDPDEVPFAAQLVAIRKQRAQLAFDEANHLDCLLTILRGNGVKEGLALVDGLAYHVTYGVNLKTMEEEIRIREHRYELRKDGSVMLILSAEDLCL